MKTLILACALAAAPLTFGQTWVSINFGNDANMCTRIYPCATFQRAENLTPAGGRLNVLDPGDYGTMVITKAMTIDGGNFASIYTSTGPAIIVEGPSSQSVQIKNMSIQSNGGGYGIYYVSAGQLLLQNVSISGFATGVFTNVTGTGTGDFVMNDTSIDNCAKALVLNSSITFSAEITNSHFRYGTGTAVTVNTGSVSISNTTFAGTAAGSASHGLAVLGGTVMVDNSQFSGFYYALEVYNPLGVQVNRSVFTHNYWALYNEQGAYPIYTNGSNSFWDDTNWGTAWTSYSALH